MTTTRQWDYGSRLRSIANTVDGVAITSHSYLYDTFNRRRQATLEDGSLWKYDYNDRDELISGKRYWADWTPVAGQQFEYGFDNIGNRQTAKEGGDASGANLRTETYTANGLNQYTSRTVPDKMDVIGAAYATATATVNNNATYRKGEYYQYALSVTNSTYPAWQGVTNKAVQGTNSESVTNHALVPPANQTLQYDKDGNLTNDAVWVYSWDGENRLIQMTNLTTVPEAARKKLVFGYDYMNRRTTKTVYGWDLGTSNWNTTAELDQKSIYDGWNLIAILNVDSSINSFTWGKDLSGTMDKAGGVGGLLMTSLSGTNCFVGYDGNGNVTVLIISDKSIGARYEHNPFGKTIRATGLLAKQNPFGFSTKYNDNESHLIYYGYRYYDSDLGRWVSNDPSGEKNGINLYAFTANSSVNAIDINGLWTVAAGFEGSAGAGLMFGSSFQITLTINGWNPLDWRGGLTGSVMPLTGVTTSITGSAGLLFSYSSAKDVRAWNGPSLTIGASAGEFAVFGVDVGNLGGGGPTKYDVFVGEGLVFGLAAMPWEAHTGASFTTGDSISPRDIINAVWDGMVEFYSK